AEAVNTACYVQNRVLVVKSHNKTPYELFNGRTPALSFIRPFGCLVTILNTKDHLGKFDGKADEGFFVGYSINSKAFRIFNSRTRIVKDNLHISPTLTTRIHKDHPLNQVIRDVQSAIQIRNMSKNLGEHWAIGTKWVFRNKKDEKGIMIRNKARLVAQGHSQEEGIDYDEVFAPAARIKAIRLFLAYASFKDFVVYQMDVKSTFLYEKIEVEVYVCQPSGFEDHDFPDKVYKVEKALYGLHKAPRAKSLKVNAARHKLTTAVDVNAKTVNGEAQLQALMDGKKVLITESTIRRDLQLEDTEGVDCLPNDVIFEQLTLIGYVSHPNP
nr:retrovirus-related Pol polyprotein from transposon TNT 1-94 [Tanacetum cinerariifolium]